MSECAEKGLCHGPLKWCDACGDVKHVCDFRLRGERCDEHPVPPTARENLKARRAAEKMIRDAAEMQREGLALLNAATDSERARTAYDKARRAQEDAK